uniref:PLAC8 family protein n=1 Tax=Opuntia streptacantha TaxID=393608 RepID=A0A7C9A2R9_OPUST
MQSVRKSCNCNMAMISTGVLTIKDEIEETHAAKSSTPSPLRKTPPREVSSGEAGNRRYSLLKSSSFRTLTAPSSKFWQIAEGKDEMSRAVQSPINRSLRERLSSLAHKISWDSLKKICREWFRNPMNWALFAWITCVAVSGAILFLVMTGMLNSALPKKSQRNTWFEVNNQILNALFTLMCLYQHPKRFHHLVMLLRWKPEDISRLRKIYCKNGTYKPHEWAHMLVVIVLLHVNCFAQYALCGLNLGYKRSERPAIGVGLCISVAIAAPAIAGFYTIVSPLGKEYDYDIPIDEEAQVPITAAEKRKDEFRLKSCEKRLSFMRGDGKIVENSPKWAGGIFDFWDDLSVAFLSLFCSFCVFGWNMERLGFGNMYVHIATFILFCSAPFWIFNLAALNINDEIVRQALGFTGVILCALGFLYGGYWRIRMRKRFNLPEYTSCCGKPAVSDFALWLCCCWCSLAQEVRTANSYDIVEDKLYRKHSDGSLELGVTQVTCDDGTVRDNNSHLNSPLVVPSDSAGISTANLSARSPVQSLEDSSRESMPHTMTPPSPLMVEREGK